MEGEKNPDQPAAGLQDFAAEASSQLKHNKIQNKEHQPNKPHIKTVSVLNELSNLITSIIYFFRKPSNLVGFILTLLLDVHVSNILKHQINVLLKSV